MAGSRVPIVVGILAIAGGLTWFALRRDHGQGSNDLTAAGSGSGSGSGRGAIFAPEGPSLGGGASAFDPPPGAPPPVLVDAPLPIDAASHRDVFAAQLRDAAWAKRTEDELEDRVRKLKLTAVQGIECRADQCELMITGPAEAVESTIAKLESTKGLPTVAKSILLGGPERSGDQLTLRVYALFDRPE